MAADGGFAAIGDSYADFAAQVRARREARDEQARFRWQLEQARLSAGRPADEEVGSVAEAPALRLEPLHGLLGPEVVRRQILRPANDS
jgi:hypothetical protein